ncbi:MAG: hypothetical protein SGILL_006059 [Bacillariaceae sp.]
MFSRSDKPGIAWKLLDIVTSRGGRFVRRNKAFKNSSNFAWEQLNDKQAYEKVCQALREGAPELRRRMLHDMRGGGRIHELEGEDEPDENSTKAIAGQKQEEDQDEDSENMGGRKASKIRTRASAKKQEVEDVYAI